MAMPNLNEIMQQAQKMQKKMQETQQKLDTIEANGDAVGGMVKAVVNGKYRLKSLYIDQSIMKDGAIIVADLVRVAVNNAVTKIEDLLRKEMLDLTKDFNLPQGMLDQGEKTGTGGSESGGSIEGTGGVGGVIGGGSSGSGGNP